MQDEYDVVVVGCGIAGLSAAVTAFEHGATVAVLERAPREERGGNTRYTESFWRMKSREAPADDLVERLASEAGLNPDPGLVRDALSDFDSRAPVSRGAGFVDPDLVGALGDGAAPALQWLERFGVRFDELPIYFLSQSARRIAPIGGGLALVEALATHAEAHADRIDIHYETALRGLRFDDDGQICGVDAIGRENRPAFFRARSVVLACGGFQGNPEMLARYLGPQSVFTRPVARGGNYNRGEGIRLALEAGAAPCGNFASFHAQPIDPRSPDPEAVVLNYAYGVLVNRHGKRFTDEAPAMTDATYEVVTRRILEEPDGLAYAVFDSKLDEVDNWTITVRSRVAPYESDTLGGLARLMDVSPASLEDTIEAFNAACPGSGGEFNPLKTDGIATKGLTPAKSNWARPVDRPPFRAWPIIAANCFTFGGLKVDARARVINLSGDPMPGLYAAGETVGLYHKVYPGATSVLRGAVTGRLAGADAARRRNA